ncbi:hypothetical protein PSHT_09390 [Puccinia striiformis]|uniref:Extracellular mutant protein 11 C-terminal domain-containing protein n=1 Tax=Puccinia striiformis TaxID=27350 RepID=A0A2S4VH89_9BASI|nr:hypothetical protein PSHT_09390 [Puccinia striiformis]
MDWVDVVKYQGKVDDWHGTIGSIVQGGGSLIKRSPESRFLADVSSNLENALQKKMQAARDVAVGPVAPGEYIQRMLGWQDKPPRTGNFWDEKIYHDPKMIQIIPNEYPFGLPDGVEHWMMWTRESPLTPDLFKPLPHEDVPNQDFLNPVRVKALIRYINHYDFYGTSGISQEVLKDFVPSAFFHLGDKVWVDPESTETVTRTEGREAMAWAGRHVATVIHTKFSPKEYEILSIGHQSVGKALLILTTSMSLSSAEPPKFVQLQRLRSPSAPANHLITPEAPDSRLEMEMSEKSQGSSDKMLPPSSRKTFIPPSPRSSVNKKSSTAQRSVPGEFSASPSIRHGLYDPKGSARSPSLSGRRTPSVGDRPSAKRGPTEVENSLMNIFDGKQLLTRFLEYNPNFQKLTLVLPDFLFQDRGLIDTQESDKGPRKRALFGNPERKNKKRNEGNSAEKSEKQTDKDAARSQRFSVQSPHISPARSSKRHSKKQSDLSSHGKALPMVDRVYKDNSSFSSRSVVDSSPLGYAGKEGGFAVPVKRIRPGFAEDRYEEPLRYPDEELRYGPYTGDSDGSPSSPYHDQIEDTERTILGPSSSPEMEKEKERKAPGLADLDESLKLVPDPGEYRPGAYNSLTDEQWLSAGQKLIEKFSENSQKVQKIISARAERMAGYTAMVSEYHNLLRQRRVELNRERESIQEGVLGSIAGYKKSNI